MRYGLKVY